ncbi:MAG: GIY-YIG nuclease family protein [Patescibacteria group bacterium]
MAITPYHFSYVYILNSIRFPRRIYIGFTNNLRKRFSQHNDGEVISTKKYAPWKLLYYEAFSKERFARQRELHLKNNGNPMRELKKRIGFDSVRKSGKGGFTLIELVVVVAIITVVTSVVLVSNTKYGGSVLLQNLAYDIALSIRQAQVYGISVRGFGTTNMFTAGYGMHFDINDNAHYELFADADGNGLFSNASENVPPSPYVIGRNYRIKKLCAPAGTNFSSCASVQQLDILYKRPEPDAWISANGNSCLLQPSNCKDSARIIVESPRGDVLSIVVDATGQISVQ